jgi:hypothetical protein
MTKSSAYTTRTKKQIEMDFFMQVFKGHEKKDKNYLTRG